jgi:hypothetical protein
MPKKPMDYSRSCIYKICCRNPDIREIYVGSTTDLVKRRYTHKCSCNNPARGGHNCSVYQYIRDNGGWVNWEVVQVEQVVCESSQELRQREREVFERLRPSLNTIRPKTSLEENKDNQRVRDKTRYHANPDRKKANMKAWGSKRVICEHCDNEVCQGGLKKHQSRKKCLAAQAAHNEYQLRNQEYINERKGITPDLDLD